MPLFCQSILHDRKPFAGLFLPLLHCTKNFQTWHFGKLIQDIDLFQTPGKSSLLPLLYFCIKPCSTYVLLVPMQRQRKTQRATLLSDLHDEGIPSLFKMRWRGLKTELSKLNNGGCRPGPSMVLPCLVPWGGIPCDTPVCHYGVIQYLPSACCRDSTDTSSYCLAFPLPFPNKERKGKQEIV